MSRGGLLSRADGQFLRFPRLVTRNRRRHPRDRPADREVLDREDPGQPRYGQPGAARLVERSVHPPATARRTGRAPRHALAAGSGRIAQAVDAARAGTISHTERGPRDGSLLLRGTPEPTARTAPPHS